MPLGRIYDAAGVTTDFLYDIDLPDLVSESPGKLTLSAPILAGRHAGEIATIEWLGAFDLAAGLGSVTGWRESVGGTLHFSLKLDAPVALGDLFDTDPGGPLVLYGNRFGNVLEGDLTDDILHGGGGSDNLIGGGGVDRLYGEDGNDRLDGGAGRDKLVGGAGDDLYIGSGDVIIEAPNGGYDVVRTGAATYVMEANVEEAQMLDNASGGATVTGNALDNLIRGTAGNDRLQGGLGNDRILGLDGNDSLRGDAGNDSLLGGNGNDRIIGGSGKDSMTGGNGADTFVFLGLGDSGLRTARDVILDFVQGSDRISVAGIDADISTAADDAFAFIGEAAFSGSGLELRYLGGILSGDVNADGRGDFQIEVADAPALTAADFFL